MSEERQSAISNRLSVKGASYLYVPHHSFQTGENNVPNPGRLPSSESLRNCMYATGSSSGRCRLSRNSLKSTLPIKSNSYEITKQSTGEPFTHPFMIVLAKAWLVLNVFPSRLRLLAIGACKLPVRPNSAFSTQVLMKFSFRNSIIAFLERTPVLKILPVPQHDSSKRGPSNETACIGFC